MRRKDIEIYRLTNKEQQPFFRAFTIKNFVVHSIIQLPAHENVFSPATAMGEARADELPSPSVVITDVGGFSNAEGDEPNTPRDLWHSLPDDVVHSNTIRPSLFLKIDSINCGLTRLFIKIVMSTSLEPGTKVYVRNKRGRV